MPRSQYAILDGNPVQYVRLLEHSKDTLEVAAGWEVQKAFYGLRDHSVGVDVTDSVHSWLQTEHSVRATNDVFGDPCPGKKKVLDVTLYQVEFSYQDVDGGPWRRTWSFQYERHYYYNPNTGASTWFWPPSEDPGGKVRNVSTSDNSPFFTEPPASLAKHMRR